MNTIQKAGGLGMGPYRLIALDLDGTLLDERCVISEQNERAIRRAMDRGVYVCIATGRGYHSAMEATRSLRLQSPLVVSNGGEVWRDPQTLHTRTPLPRSVIPQLRQLAEQWDVWFWAYSVEGLYNRDRWHEEEQNTDWLKFGFYTELDDVRASIRAQVTDLGMFEVTSSHPYNVELNPLGVSKATGLHTVGQLLGIDVAQMIAVGDSENDATMLQAVGLGVAMGNADETIRALARAVTLTNKEHGVAAVIEQYILA